MSDKILDEIKTRLKQAEDYWQENYQRGVEDKEFVTVEGAQWGLHEVQKRIMEKYHVHVPLDVRIIGEGVQQER